MSVNLFDFLSIYEFFRLNDLCIRIRTKINNDVFDKIFSRLTKETIDMMDDLLKLKDSSSRTTFNDLKQLPKNATLNHLKDRLDHLKWLENMGDVENIIKDIRMQKILSFADKTKVLDAAEIKNLSKPKRYTFILCLIYQATIKTRDNLIEMFLKRMHAIHTNAKERLEQIQLQNRKLNEELIDAFNDVLEIFQEYPDEDRRAGKKSRREIDKNGGLDYLLEKCCQVNAYKNKNYIPLLWNCYRIYRSTLFRLVRAIKLSSTTEDNSLMEALDYLIANRNKRSKYLSADVRLDFASNRWKKEVIRTHRGQQKFLRREFEVCVFSYLANELKAGDTCMVGSESFADYRLQLSTWEECLTILDEYCKDLDLPNTSTVLVSKLKSILEEKANSVDNGFPDNEELMFDEKGLPKLKRLRKVKITPEALEMAQLIYSRMPERHIIDILCNCQHWTNFVRHFGPLSGSDPKLSDPIIYYVYNTFTYGCNLGPLQAARHSRIRISPHTLSYINTRHVNSEKLDYSIADVVNEYCQLRLPKHWGDGTRVAADGTKIDIYEQNLLAEYHIRYGGYGGIAYHHVADSYIILFSHFIPCGVYEAVYIIEGLLRNKSDITPNIIHGDTQSQSTTVFGLSLLLGIKLMPRIRNWKDLTLYRPKPDSRYNHIDSLFGDPIDWNLIETHWKDMMQVALSIKQGKISSAMILRKLGNYSRKNKLYKAFRELGRVIRTIFLLDYISDPELRRIIHVTTNKVESYNVFSELLRFGGYGVLQTNDPIEQEKRVKYNDLVANAVMLQNVHDITKIVKDLIEEGYEITPEVISILSPYKTHSIKKFGEYNIDLSVKPPPLYEDSSIIDIFNQLRRTA